MRSRLTSLLLGALALASAGVPERARAQVAEAELKAAFVFNFVAFVTWPDRQSAADDVLGLCVRSGSALAEALGRLDGKTTDDRRIAVRTLTSAEQAAACDVVVVDADRPADPAAVAEGAIVPVGSSRPWPPDWWRRDGVLSVADGGDSARNGAVITLVREGARVRFDVDSAAAERARLTLSSKLLRLARRVL